MTAAEPATTNRVGVRLRAASLADHPRIMKLEASQGLRVRSFEDWSRLWLANPEYRRLDGKWPIGWVLEADDGEIAGSLGNVPVPYLFRGRPVTVAAGRAWVTSEPYRGFALLLMDQYFSQPGVDVFLNTTVNARAADAFGTFGSVRVPVGQWDRAAFWITGYRGFARAALQLRSIPAPDALSWAASPVLFLRQLAKRALPPPPPIRVDVLTSFDYRCDEFWDRLRRMHAAELLAVRSREAMEWHFGAALAAGRIVILRVAGADTPRAQAVFERRDEPNTGLRRLRLIDYQSLDCERECLLAILHRALEFCRSQQIHVLEQVGCHLKRTALVDEHAPWRRKLPGWCFYFRGGSSVTQAALADASVWDPSSYDGDASL